MTTPPTPQDVDLRTEAADAITLALCSAWPVEIGSDLVFAEQVGRIAADAVLAAVEPVIRRQVAEERTYPNVKIGDEEFEHYDRLGPGCWHPVKGNGPCLSWQGLIREAGFRAAAIARSHSTREEQDHE